jgi:hypothetical protein
VASIYGQVSGSLVGMSRTAGSVPDAQNEVSPVGIGKYMITPVVRTSRHDNRRDLKWYLKILQIVYVLDESTVITVTRNQFMSAGVGT